MSYNSFGRDCLRVNRASYTLTVIYEDETAPLVRIAGCDKDIRMPAEDEKWYSHCIIPSPAFVKGQITLITYGGIPNDTQGVDFIINDKLAVEDAFKAENNQEYKLAILKADLLNHATTTDQRLTYTVKGAANSPDRFFVPFRMVYQEY